MGNSAGSFRDYLLLGKLNIMIPVSLSGFTGYFLYKPVFSPGIILVTAGIFFMSVSASAINQLQEIETDRKMERTKNRPLPSGKVSVRAAIFFTIITFIGGSCCLYFAGSLRAYILCLLTIIWYNGVYTYLKRVTPYAVLPGAVTGALPPLIGWIAAGGEPFSISIILVQLLFFAGQIPHFWLLLIKYGDEYSHAGLPSLTSVISKKRLSVLVIAFVVVSALAAISIDLYGVIHNSHLSIFLFIVSALLVLFFSGFKQGKDPARYSLMLNIYFLFIMLLLVSDRII